MRCRRNQDINKDYIVKHCICPNCYIILMTVFQRQRCMYMITFNVETHRCIFAYIAVIELKLVIIHEFKRKNVSNRNPQTSMSDFFGTSVAFLSSLCNRLLYITPKYSRNGQLLSLLMCCRMNCFSYSSSTWRQVTCACR